MGERRPTNSELHLARLEEAEARRDDEERGILEIFEEPERDEDAPLGRERE